MNKKSKEMPRRKADFCGSVQAASNVATPFGVPANSRDTWVGGGSCPAGAFSGFIFRPAQQKMATPPTSKRAMLHLGTAANGSANAMIASSPRIAARESRLRERIGSFLPQPARFSSGSFAGFRYLSYQAK